MLSVNNYLFGEYRHRISYKKINAIEVKGDVKEVEINQIYRERYPEEQISNISSAEQETEGNIFKVPYIAHIAGGFTRNKSIHILARVKMLPHSITINLQQKPFFWPHPTIACHINPRFSGGKHMICRNTWSNGRWQKEERTDSAKDLMPGKTFKMIITCDFESYQIHLNDQFFAEYRFRCDPCIVDTLNIFGDIVLKKVWLETKNFN